MAQEYRWKGAIYKTCELFPSFSPVDEPGKNGSYYVGLTITCQPNAGIGHYLDAYPEALRKSAFKSRSELNKRFLLEWADDEGNRMEDMTFEQAAALADKLNEAYHYAIKEASRTWEWDALPLDLARLPLVRTW